ncbi:acyl carrier protein [Streptomyces sp. NPDC018007]|uniref:acyl carrier protein n=1 Tax=Streptomyces sp. NPDC018007 TaxID=3365029 RepID=UPI0037ADE1EE
MGTVSKQELAKRVKGVVVDALDLDMEASALADDMSLYSSTLKMDSMTLLHLLVTFEGEFDIEIDDEIVMNANLDTVHSLVNLVWGVVSTRDAEPVPVAARDGLEG